MDRFQGVIGIVLMLGLAILLSRHRNRINWRTLGVGLFLQIAFALLVLKWSWGFEALKWMAGGIETAIGYTTAGTEFVFGPLMGDKIGFVFALNVLPVIIFLGAIIGALYYLRVIQFIVDIVGGALSKVLGVSKVESVWASTVIFLGQSEAPLVIAPYIRTLTTSQLFTCMTGGFAAVAGSTLIGYSLLGAPLPYLLAAAVMNAPGSILVAKAFWPETEEVSQDANVRNVRDTESTNIIDAIGRGAMSGGKIAVIVGCLLIAFIALIALISSILGGIGGWFGHPELTLQGVFGWVFAPLAWIIGVPWNAARRPPCGRGRRRGANWPRRRRARRAASPRRRSRRARRGCARPPAAERRGRRPAPRSSGARRPWPGRRAAPPRRRRRVDLRP